MKQTNFEKWKKYEELSNKYYWLFVQDCKREIELYCNEEAKKKILEKLTITTPLGVL